MPATAIDGTPVVVVFFNIPVVNPAKDVPFIFPTTVALCVPVTSPARLPVKEAALPLLTAEITKAVVASCVVFVPAVAVGAAGIPVNVGDASGAFKASLPFIFCTACKILSAAATIPEPEV